MGVGPVRIDRPVQGCLSFADVRGFSRRHAWWTQQCFERPGTAFAGPSRTASDNSEEIRRIWGEAGRRVDVFLVRRA